MESEQLEKYLKQLDALTEVSKNPKILWEEMVQVLEKADKVEEKILITLEKKEEDLQSVDEVQDLFDLREAVWDTVDIIQQNALRLREKTFKSTDGEAHHCCGRHQRNCQTEESEPHCCCQHEREKGEHHCCCHHEEHQGCCHEKNSEGEEHHHGCRCKHNV